MLSPTAALVPRRVDVLDLVAMLNTGVFVTSVSDIHDFPNSAAIADLPDGEVGQHDRERNIRLAAFDQAGKRATAIRDTIWT